MWKSTLPDEQVYAASDTKDQSGVRGDVQGVYATTYRGCTRPRTGGVRDDVHKPKNEPKKEPPNEPPKQNTGCSHCLKTPYAGKHLSWQF